MFEGSYYTLGVLGREAYFLLHVDYCKHTHTIKIIKMVIIDHY